MRRKDYGVDQSSVIDSDIPCVSFVELSYRGSSDQARLTSRGEKKKKEKEV